MDNPKASALALSEEMDHDKVNVFNLWLEHGKDMDRVAKLKVARESIRTTSSKHKGKPMKQKDIEALYGEEKAKVVMQMAKNSGNMRPDIYFPRDEKDNIYTIYVGAEFTMENSHRETFGVHAESDVHGSDLDALVGKEGVLSNLAIAGMAGYGSEAATDLVSRMQGEAPKAVKRKESTEKKDKNKDDSSDPKKAAKTKSQEAEEIAAQAKKEAQAARFYSISIKAHEYSAELCKQMEAHAAFMEAPWRRLTTMLREQRADAALSLHPYKVHEVTLMYVSVCVCVCVYVYVCVRCGGVRAYARACVSVCVGGRFWVCVMFLAASVVCPLFVCLACVCVSAGVHVCGFMARCLSLYLYVCLSV